MLHCMNKQLHITVHHINIDVTVWASPSGKGAYGFQIVYISLLLQNLNILHTVQILQANTLTLITILWGIGSNSMKILCMLNPETLLSKFKKITISQLFAWASSYHFNQYDKGHTHIRCRLGIVQDPFVNQKEPLKKKTCTCTSTNSNSNSLLHVTSKYKSLCKSCETKW